MYIPKIANNTIMSVGQKIKSSPNLPSNPCAKYKIKTIPG